MVARDKGKAGYTLGATPEGEEVAHGNAVTTERAAGLYGSRTRSSAVKNKHNHSQRSFKDSSSKATSMQESVGRSTSTRSLFSRFHAAGNDAQTRFGAPSVHIVCSISENQARETCVTSIDVGSPTYLTISKQGNGQTYSETIAYLENLQPNEILLNEGRRSSPLAQKVTELYESDESKKRIGRGQNGRNWWSGQEREDETERDEGGNSVPDDGRYGTCDTAAIVKFISRSLFDQTKGATLLRRIAREETYDAAVVEDFIMLSSAHAVVNYMQTTLGTHLTKNSLSLCIVAGGSNRMVIDRATLSQLELLVNAKTGKARNSLIGTIDSTKTTVGSRLLRMNLMAPPTRTDTINSRLELVDAFLASADFFHTVFDHLSNLPDVDKMLSNVALVPKSHTANPGSPPVQLVRHASRGIASLLSIKAVLSALPSLSHILRTQLETLVGPNYVEEDDHEDESNTAITGKKSLLIGLGGGERPGAMTVLRQHHLLKTITTVLEEPKLVSVLDIVSAVLASSPASVRSVDARRHQECFALEDNGQGILHMLRKSFLKNVDDIFRQADECAEAFGMNVTVRYSSVRGYYLAVPATFAAELPADFIHPAKNGRFIVFTTREIASLNTRAQDNVRDILVLTHDRIMKVMGEVRVFYDELANMCDAIALLDMCHSFADTVSASTLPWCRPFMHEQTDSRGPKEAARVEEESSATYGESSLMIRNGRYAIAASESGLEAEEGPTEFIPNDTYAAKGKNFTLISGINGSGKSTYLKQIAIIVVLAHCGSYVPAEQASIATRDRLCTRIGNTDDQEHNISTFMQEMKETAFVCRNATQKSLVLLDELGRATSNEDGVAIAWSVAEHLMKRRAMVFFVTHYPQLTQLSDAYPMVQNVHLEASVSPGKDGGINYTHKLVPGSCRVSTDYGVEMAAHCGWQVQTINKAKEAEAKVRQLLPGDQIRRRPAESEADGRSSIHKKLLNFKNDIEHMALLRKTLDTDDIRVALAETQSHFLRDVTTDQLARMDKPYSTGASRIGSLRGAPLKSIPSTTQSNTDHEQDSPSDGTNQKESQFTSSDRYSSSLSSDGSGSSTGSTSTSSLSGSESESEGTGGHWEEEEGPDSLDLPEG